MANSERSRATSYITVAMCLAAALAEGVDLQSAGIAARGVAAEFGFARDQVGNFVSFSILGLLFGAAIGGRLADRIGRKAVLILAVVTFGVFSFVTAFAENYPMLLAARFLTGLGLGGAMANFVALSSEAAAPNFKSTAVALVYLGLPLGSIVTAQVGSIIEPAQWRNIFYVGCAAPLAVVPLLYFFLPESAAFKESRNAPKQDRAAILNGLFGAGNLPMTLLLWTGFFFVQLAIYLVLNWMPTLLGDQGFDQHQSSIIQTFFSIGSIVGSLVFGRIMDLGKRRMAVLAAFGAAIVSQLALATVTGFYPVIFAIFAAGLFLAGAQLILLATAPLSYGVNIRGSGVGAAVAAGRFGGYIGPSAAGYLLKAGMPGSEVMLMSVPGLCLAGIATLLVLIRPRREA